MGTVFDQSGFVNNKDAANISSYAISDNFRVGSPVKIDHAVIYLTEGFNNIEGTLETVSDTIGWAIYTDAGGKPGSLLASGNDATPILTDTGENLTPAGTMVSLDIFKAEIDLGTGVVLPAGSYWLAIHEGPWGSPADVTSVFWVHSGTGQSPEAWADDTETNPTVWNLPVGAELAFSLVGMIAPEFTTSTTLSADENQTAVAKIAATDGDNDILTFSLTHNGADDGLFDIASDGTLTFLAAPDFENPTDADVDGVYEVEVKVSDGTFDVWQTFKVTVDDVNEDPVITSDGGKLNATVSVAENSTAVTKVQSSDQEDSFITYAISGGDDKTLFSINATTGKITFKSAPDFEEPQDKNHDNAYQITVRATDSDGAIDIQYLTINVTDVDGVTITGTENADKVNAKSTVDGQALPTGEQDYILGLGGNDRLSGLGGDDILEGGEGKDILKGGAGHDHFVYFDVADSNAVNGIDRIRDFTQGEDVIDLSDIDADGAGGMFHFVGEADFDGTAGALRQRTAGSDVFLEGDTDGNGVADLVILLKGSAGLVLTDSDLSLGLV